MNNKTILNVFTDTMMGLSYESEPILDRLRKDYAEKIEIRYIMSLLVRDISDFMTPEEREMNPADGIRCYCRRLAKIYKNEESIGGLSMNMNGFRLFDTLHRSSKPLCLAYKAAQLTSPDKADDFLFALRRATVLECRPTTHFEEILRIIRNTGIDENTFTQYYNDGSAQQTLNSDLIFTHKMNIHSLPSYLIQSNGKAALFQSFKYNDFKTAIQQITDYSLK